jgi:hypothetical protein
MKPSKMKSKDEMLDIVDKMIGKTAETTFKDDVPSLLQASRNFHLKSIMVVLIDIRDVLVNINTSLNRIKKHLD